MHILPSLCAVTLLSLVACQHADSTAQAGSEGGAATPGAAATGGSPSGGGGFASGFEGAISMHVTSNGHAEDLSFLTKGGKLRVDAPAHNGEMAHIVFDPSTNKTLVILDTQKMYMEMDKPAGAMGANPAVAGPPPQIKKTGKHETVAGTDCEDWTSTDAKGRTAALCVAKGVAFFDFAAMGPAKGESSAWIDQLRSEQYFPLRAVDTDATGKELSRMEVTKIEKKTLDDSLFTPPAGYHAMVMPQLGGMGMPPGMGLPPGINIPHH